MTKKAIKVVLEIESWVTEEEVPGIAQYFTEKSFDQNAFFEDETVSYEVENFVKEEGHMSYGIIESTKNHPSIL